MFFVYFNVLIDFICSVPYHFSTIVSSQFQDTNNKRLVRIFLLSKRKTSLAHELLISHFMFPAPASDASEPKLLQNGVWSGCGFFCEHITVLFFVCLPPYLLNRIGNRNHFYW